MEIQTQVEKTFVQPTHLKKVNLAQRMVWKYISVHGEELSCAAENHLPPLRSNANVYKDIKAGIASIGERIVPV